MIDLLFQMTLSNVCVSLVLAITASIVGGALKRPVISHLLWLLVFVKLLTPPVVIVPAIPVSWMDNTISEVDMKNTIEQQVMQNVRVSEREDNAFVSSKNKSVMFIQGKHVLLLAWLSGSMVVFLWSLLRVFRFHRLLGKESEAGKHEIQSIAEEIASGLCIKAVPTIYTTSANISPMVWWIGGRVWVVIPASLIERLDAGQLRWVLSHELAHVRRRDYVVRWIEWLACVCFWWNPVTWWARYNLRVNEELCCDALVLSSMSPKPYIYGDSLLKAIEILTYPVCNPSMMTSGMNDGELLKRRVKMIISKKMYGANSHWLKACILLGALMILPLGFTQARQSDGNKQHKAESTYLSEQERAVDVEKTLVEDLQREKIYQMKVELDALSSRYSPDHPDVIRLSKAMEESEQVLEQMEEIKARRLSIPAVTINGNTITSYRIYVLGKVRNPGMINFDKPVTVLQALAMTGGLTEWANEKEIRVIRKNGTEHLTYNFNYQDVIKGNNLEQDITLLSGDVLVVP